jgi:hypothetical protein
MRVSRDMTPMAADEKPGEARLSSVVVQTHERRYFAYATTITVFPIVLAHVIQRKDKPFHLCLL